MSRHILLAFCLLLTHFASAQFTPLCTGTTNGFVVDFAEYQNEIYATGFFTTLCGKSTGHIGKWNGTQWSQGAMGGIDEGHALEVIDDALYIASYEFGTDSNYVVRWNGTNLTTLGTVYRTNANPNQSQTSSIYDIVKFGNEIVVSGEFNWVAGQSMPGITRWNGTTWLPLGSGLSGSITVTPPVLYPHQMLVFNGDLIVCGNFSKAGDQIVNGIARWDGQAWHAMSDGFNATVYGVGIFDGVLYAGGEFTKSGNTALGRIARWNGNAWENPGFEVEYSLAGVKPFVHTLRQIGDSLYVAGGFNRIKTPAAAFTASGVVVWNNQTINTLGGGTPNKEIEAVIPYNNGVLVGGGGSNNSGYLGFWKPGTSSAQTLVEAGDLMLYPNPVNESFNIRGLENYDYELITLKNAGGRMFMQTRLSGSNEVVIDLPDLPDGVYFVEFSGSKTLGPLQRKVMVIKE